MSPFIFLKHIKEPAAFECSSVMGMMEDQTPMWHRVPFALLVTQKFMHPSSLF